MKILLLILGIIHTSTGQTYPYQDEIHDSIVRIISNSSQTVNDVQILNDEYFENRGYFDYMLQYLNSFAPIVNLQLISPESFAGSVNENTYSLALQVIVDAYTFDDDTTTFDLLHSQLDPLIIYHNPNENTIIVFDGTQNHTTVSIVLNIVTDDMFSFCNYVFSDLDALDPELFIQNVTCSDHSAFLLTDYYNQQSWANKIYRISTISEDTISQTYNVSFDELSNDQKISLSSASYGTYQSMQAVTASIIARSYFAYFDMIDEQYLDGLEIEDVADPVTQNVLILNQKVLDLESKVLEQPQYGTIYDMFASSSGDDLSMSQCFRALAFGCTNTDLVQKSFSEYSITRMYVDGYDYTDWDSIINNYKWTFCPDALPPICKVKYETNEFVITQSLQDYSIEYYFKAYSSKVNRIAGVINPYPGIYGEANEILRLFIDLGTGTLEHKIQLVKTKTYLTKAVSLPFNIPSDAVIKFLYLDLDNKEYVATSSTFDLFEETVNNKQVYGFQNTNFQTVTDDATLNATIISPMQNWYYVHLNCDTNWQNPPLCDECACGKFYDSTFSELLGVTKIALTQTPNAEGTEGFCDTQASFITSSCPQYEANTFFVDYTSISGGTSGRFQLSFEGATKLLYLTNEIKTSIITYNDFEGYIITALNSLARMTLPRLDDLEARVGTLEAWVEAHTESTTDMLLSIFLSVTQIGFAISDIGKTIKTTSKLNELKLGRYSYATESSLAEDFITPFKENNLYTKSLTYDPVRSMYEGSIYNYAHLYTKSGWRSDILKLKSTQDVTFEMLKDKDIALDIREVMQLSTTDFLQVQKVIQNGLPKIESYLAPFGSVQALKSPIAELGLVGRKLENIKPLTKGERSFLSNTYQKYPFHTSTVTTLADIDEEGNIIVSTRFAGVGEPSIIGPTNVKNPKVKLGYIKTQYKYDSTTNKLSLLNWDEVKIGNKQMYEEEDINELYRAFYQEGFGNMYEIELTTTQKWEGIVTALNSKIKSRDTIDSIPLPNSIYHDMVDNLVYFSQSGNSFGYNLLNNNCQNFVKSFAKIISGKQIALNLKSSDYSYIAQKYLDQADEYFESSQFMRQNSIARIKRSSSGVQFIQLKSSLYNEYDVYNVTVY